MSEPRILFYVKRNLHLPHLEPIARRLVELAPDVDARVSAPPYLPPSDVQPGHGLPEAERRALRERGLNWLAHDRVNEWSADAVVMADADFAGRPWARRLVNVNHGLISKGWYYTNRPGVQRENAADLICVPGPHHAAVLRRVLHTPVLATGLVKFDPVGRGELTKERARAALGLPAHGEVVLFAPTFNYELSAVPVLTDRVRELTRGGRHLLIKLHGMASPVWGQLYRTLARIEERIHFIEDLDLVPPLVASDVVISDVSSAFMEAIALGRPVVLVDNPLQARYIGYDPNDIEYAWRHVGLRASTAEDTLRAVERSFARPEEKAELRREYGRKLAGEIDGRAAERAARAILRLVRAEVPAPAPETSTHPG